MKRFDDSTKKLIKNVAALLTSALVLIAATVAWFTSGGTASKAGQFRGNVMNNDYSVSYFRLNTVDYVLESATTGTGSSAAFTFSSDVTPFTQPTLADRMTATWDETNGGAGAWDIDSLYPGEYDAFKIDVQYTTPELIISGITCKDTAGNDTLTAQQKEDVYKNVYLYAVAVKTTTTTTTDPETGDVLSSTTTYAPLTSTGNADCIVCDSLYNLFNRPSQGTWNVAGTQSITTLANINPNMIESGETTSILLFVGVPGATVDNVKQITQHNTLRQIGAKISFGPVKVSES